MIYENKMMPMLRSYRWEPRDENYLHPLGCAAHENEIIW